MNIEQQIKSVGNLRVQRGAQGEYASAGDYSKGTYIQVGSRTYGGEWYLYGEQMTPELSAMLDSARRYDICG